MHHAPPTPPPDGPGRGKPPRKRRRTLPDQGNGADESEVDDDNGTLRSARLKRWTIGLGKRERERVKQLEMIARGKVERKPRKEVDEIARERGVLLLPEGRGA